MVSLDARIRAQWGPDWGSQGTAPWASWTVPSVKRPTLPDTRTPTRVAGPPSRAGA